MGCRQRHLVWLMVLSMPGWALEEDLGQLERISNLFFEPQANVTMADGAVVLHPRALLSAGAITGHERDGAIDAGISQSMVGSDLRWSPTAGQRVKVDASMGFVGSTRRGWDEPLGMVGGEWRFRSTDHEVSLSSQATKDTPQRDEAFELPQRIMQHGAIDAVSRGVFASLGGSLRWEHERQITPSIAFRPGDPDFQQGTAEMFSERRIASRWSLRAIAVVQRRTYDQPDSPQSAYVRQGARVGLNVSLSPKTNLDVQLGADHWQFTALNGRQDHGQLDLAMPRAEAVARWDYRDDSFVSLSWTCDSIPGARSDIAQRSRYAVSWWHLLPSPWVVTTDTGWTRVREIDNEGDQWQMMSHNRVIYRAGDGIRYVGEIQGERVGGIGGRDAVVWGTSLAVIVLL